MASIVSTLTNKKTPNFSPPDFVINNTQYEVLMGSHAYGSDTEESDFDIYGFCIPPKNIVFPHLAGEILGFDEQGKRFEQFTTSHIIDPNNKQEYDITIYGIVKYFKLVMGNNPNMLDSLFVPENCIKYITKIGQEVRDNRKLFLSKHVKHTFTGYAYSQLHKIKIKTPDVGSKRLADIEAHGYDTKFAAHVIRLINEADQILTEGDLDLTRSAEMLKAIRRGEYTLEQIEQYFKAKDMLIENLYNKSSLPYSPNVAGIKTLLLNCLEEFYGDISNCVAVENKYSQAIKDIQKIVGKL
jgi:predicted nucleotidyltransferase